MYTLNYVKDINLEEKDSKLLSTLLIDLDDDDNIINIPFDLDKLFLKNFNDRIININQIDIAIKLSDYFLVNYIEFKINTKLNLSNNIDIDDEINKFIKTNGEQTNIFIKSNYKINRLTSYYTNNEVLTVNMGGGRNKIINEDFNFSDYFKVNLKFHKSEWIFETIELDLTEEFFNISSEVTFNIFNYMKDYRLQIHDIIYHICSTKNLLQLKNLVSIGIIIPYLFQICTYFNFRKGIIYCLAKKFHEYEENFNKFYCSNSNEVINEISKLKLVDVLEFSKNFCENKTTKLIESLDIYTEFDDPNNYYSDLDNYDSRTKSLILFFKLKIKNTNFTIKELINFLKEEKGNFKFRKKELEIICKAKNITISDIKDTSFQV